MTDVVFISPNNQALTYQGLASAGLSAVEPPTWALLLSESMRSKGFKVAIIDSLAEGLTDTELQNRILILQPKIICFVVYGQNVNAGTTSMGGAVRQAACLKDKLPRSPIVIVGSHVQALPVETLEKELSLDIVVLNEGVKALEALLSLESFEPEFLESVPGIMFRASGEIGTGCAPISLDQKDLERELPGYAWDLLPYKFKPLDLYRSPTWHADYVDELRSPYAAVQTSIGCQFKCGFCMINLINKNDLEPQSTASNYAGMRYWSEEFVGNEVEKLYKAGVKTIRITDEMFFLNRKRYIPILNRLAALNVDDDLRLWAYARIDTVPSPEILKLIREAGFRWLCVGIESGSKAVRLEVAKGKFEEVDVTRVVRQIEAADINVMANYIFGLPSDTEDSINETYNLSVKLNTLGWNTYAAMALPGSPLYTAARARGESLPEDYEEYSFHSYRCKPLGTEFLPAWRVLQLRDEKFVQYFARPEFLKKVEHKFGKDAANLVFNSSRQMLTRQIIEHAAET